MIKERQPVKIGFTKSTHPHKLCGIHLIFGPMFSGKTRELLRMVNRYKRQGFETLLLRKSNTSRDGIDVENLVSSRDGNEAEACIEVDSLLNMSDDVWKRIEKASIIAIDEGQFLTGLIQFCGHHVFNQKFVRNGVVEKKPLPFRSKLIIIAMLNGDFLQRPFQYSMGSDGSRVDLKEDSFSRCNYNVFDITSWATKVTHLTSVCHYCCDDCASFTIRVDGDDLVITSDEKVNVIGSENYRAICCNCLIKINNL